MTIPNVGKGEFIITDKNFKSFYSVYSTKDEIIQTDAPALALRFENYEEAKTLAQNIEKKTCSKWHVMTIKERPNMPTVKEQ